MPARNNKRVRPIVRPVLLLTALLFPGCRHFEPRPLEPEENLTALEGRTLNDPGLLEFVEAQRPGRPLDWDLETLTLAALYFHPDVEAARARWAVAEAGRITAGQRPNPTLGVSPQYDVTTSIPSPWIVTPTLSVPIETAGKRGKRLAVAAQLSHAARWEIAAVAWNVRAGLRRALLELWFAGESEAAWAERVGAGEELVRLLAGQLEAGEIALIEVSRERVALEQARLELLDARSRRLTARVQLAAALGLPARALEGVAFSFSAFTQPPAELPRAEARQRALLNRADILATLAQYAASEAALRLEIARQYPDIRFGPNYQFDQGDHMWGIALSVDLPVLNQNQGPIAEAEARRREQAARFNGVQIRVLAEIDTALAAYEAARQRLAAADRVVDQLVRQERLAREMFEAGEISRHTVAAARVERTSATLAQLAARLRAQETLGQLESALQTPSEFDPAAHPMPRADAAGPEPMARRAAPQGLGATSRSGNSDALASPNGGHAVAPGLAPKSHRQPSGPLAVPPVFSRASQSGHPTAEMHVPPGRLP
jgi:outer membrane protein TolC